MKNKIVIKISESKKYQNSAPEFRGNLIMVDLVSVLVENLKNYGELKTFHGKIQEGASVQVLKIQDIISINVIENSLKDIIEIEYSINENQSEIENVIKQILSEF